MGLLENPVKHAWWSEIASLGHRERLSVQGSLFLARKALPSAPDSNMADKHAALMETPSREAPADFGEFSDRLVDELFPVGWDRSYKQHVYQHSPIASSCLEYGRSKGGTRRFVSEMGPDWFYDVCLGADSSPMADYPVRYSVVETGGKMRGVTVASGTASTLAPLHRTLYDHLCQYEWMLRGEARGKRFKSFHRVSGEVFVSGDYESATDNLNLSSTERVLSRILSRCRFVPAGMRRFAMQSLRAKISYPGGRVVEQQRGQLMGNFLSFPLLCLQNYITFRFCIPRPVPVRINGDDIVFRCRPHEYKRWIEGVGAAGLTLSVGKTLVSRSSFSLNSAFFDAQSRRVREIPVIRSSMLIVGQGLPGQNEFTKFIRGWKGLARRLVGGLWLRSRRSQIQATGRSVEDLGFRADPSQLHTAGLADREAFLRGSKSTRASRNPTPPLPRYRGDTPLRSDWVFTHSPLWYSSEESDKADQDHRDWCSAQAWKPAMGINVAWEEWWREVRGTGLQAAWLSWKRTARKVRSFRGCRSLGLSLRSARETTFQRGRWVPSCEFQFVRCERPGLGWP